jgi:hypothetical protein
LSLTKKIFQDFQNQRYIDIFKSLRKREREREREKGKRKREKEREREQKCGQLCF